MKNIENLKKATFLSFLIIFFSGEHVISINLIAILITFLDFFSIGIHTFGMDSVISFFLSGLSILSLIFVFNKSKLLSIVSILVQYIWLIYCFNQYILFSIYYLISLSLFVILSLALIYVQLKKHKSVN